MTSDWIEVYDGLHHARMQLTDGRVIGLQVEDLLETGWDWHVWDSQGGIHPRYGLADTLKEAKAKAELAMRSMLTQITMPQQTEPLSISGPEHPITDYRSAA